MTNSLPIEGLSCEELYKRYTAALDNLQSMIGDARAMLRNITNAVNYPIKRLLAILNEYMSALNNLNALDFSNINKVINALKKMLDCPLLAKEIGSQVESILDNVGKGKKAIMSMVKTMLSGIADRIISAVTPIQAMVNAPVKALTDKFNGFVNGPVKPVMNMLSQLQQCLGNMCAAYKAVREFSPGSIIKPLEKYGVKYVDVLDANGKPTGKKEFQTNVAETIGNKFNDMKSKTLDQTRAQAAQKCDAVLKSAEKLKQRAMHLDGSPEK